MVIATWLVDFRCKWPPRITVLVAAVAPVLIAFFGAQQADSITAAAPFYVALVFTFYGLMAGGFTYAFVRPR